MSLSAGLEACEDAGAGVCSDDPDTVCSSDGDCAGEGAVCDSNGDHCLDTCAVAVCGDGELCAGSECTSGPGGGAEDCDAGSANSDTSASDDLCMSDCSDRGVCGDTNDDGRLTVIDALLTLKKALSIPVSVSFWNANVNSDSRILAGDALLILKKALSVSGIDLACSDGALTVTVDDAVTDVGVISLSIDYSNTAMTVVGEGLVADCEFSGEGSSVLTVFNNDVSTSTLLFGLISATPLALEAGESLFTCTFRELDMSVDINPVLTLTEATDASGVVLAPFPELSLSY